MIPYSNLLYFYILLLALIPAIILRMLNKQVKAYSIIVNFLMLLVIFGFSKHQLVFLVAFITYESILVKVYINAKMKSGLSDKGFVIWALVLLSVIPLLVSKYGGIFSNHKELGFLGISYVTFKVVQIILEIHDGLIKELDIFSFLYFVLFFPTISSGPIDRSRRFMADLNNTPSRHDYIELLGQGLWKVLLGVGYKFVIGYLISYYWLDKIPAKHTILNTINYMYAYSFYLFFDFAGYSLIAIGVSYILGIKTPENFNKPFLSKDIKDFWNRWHMSLSFWFRDFVYTRYVMAMFKNKELRKHKYLNSYTGYLITMGLMGLWHGTAVYYLLYGLYHGILIIITDLFQRKAPFYKQVKNNIVWQCFSIFVTFNLICLGFLIFSGHLFAK